MKKIPKFKGEVREETIYCGSEKLRIRKNDKASYLILKSGKIHQDFREEIKIKFKREDFEKMKEILKRIGFPPIAIWKRKRLVFDWNGIKVFWMILRITGKLLSWNKSLTKVIKKRHFLI